MAYQNERRIVDMGSDAKAAAIERKNMKTKHEDAPRRRTAGHIGQQQLGAASKTTRSPWSH
jgi:hypothetical protein